MSDAPMDPRAGTDSATLARDLVEWMARRQCSPGEIAATLWAKRMHTRDDARQLVRDIAEDIAAWRLAGRAEQRCNAYDVALGDNKLSPGQAAMATAWAKTHLGWEKQGMDPSKQGKTEAAEGAGAAKLKVAGT